MHARFTSPAPHPQRSVLKTSKVPVLREKIEKMVCQGLWGILQLDNSRISVRFSNLFLLLDLLCHPAKEKVTLSTYLKKEKAIELAGSRNKEWLFLGDLLRVKNALFWGSLGGLVS